MNDTDRFDLALKLGPLALLRLRAEVLLERINDPQKPPVTITDEQREELARIASAPQLDDRAFLGSLAYIYKDD